MQYLITVITRFAVKGVNLITFLILARLLTLDDFAKYGLVFNTSLLLSVLLDLGLRNSSAYFMGKNRSDTKIIVSTIFKYISVAGFSSFIIIVLLNETSIIDFELSFLQITAAALVCIGLFYIRTLQGVFLGFSKVNFVNRSDMIQKLVLVFMVASIFYASLDDLSYVLWAFGLSTLLASVYIIYKIRSLVNQEASDITDSSSFDYKKMFIRGAIFMSGSFCMIVYKKLGFYIADAEGGSLLSGIYFGINRFAEVITEVGIAVSMVLFSRNVKSTDRSRSLVDAAKSVRLSLFVLVITSIIFSILAEYILQYGLGEKFISYTGLYRVALVASLFGLMPTIMYPTLTVLYHPTRVAFLYFVMMSFNYVLSVYLFSNMGLEGIMLSLLCTNIILMSFLLFYIKSRECVSPLEFLIVKKEDFSFLKKLK